MSRSPAAGAAATTRQDRSTPGASDWATVRLQPAARGMSRAIVAHAVRGGSAAWHRDGRGARRSRREEGEYREYSTDEQRRAPGCIARRMQRDFHHGLLDHVNVIRASIAFGPTTDGTRRWMSWRESPTGGPGPSGTERTVCPGSHRPAARVSGVVPAARSRAPPPDWHISCPRSAVHISTELSKPATPLCAKGIQP